MADADLKNIAVFDLNNNPEGAGIFATKKVGDKVRVFIEGPIKEISGDGKVTMYVKKLGYEGDDEEEVKTSVEEPVAVAVMRMPENAYA